MADKQQRTIDRIRTVYFASRKRLEVPEWPDDQGHPLEIFYTPLTGRDSENINARDTKTDAEYLAAIIIQKAMTEDNQPHFTWGDMHALLSEAHYPVIFRIAQAMQTSILPERVTIEDAKKNSEPTTP